MMRFIRAGLTLALSLGAGGSAGAQTSSTGGPPQIEVLGRGESRVQPDRATVTISVETQGSSAATVAAENARIQARVLDTLRALGFGEPQVTTLRFNVSPNWVWEGDQRRNEGYIARNAVRVRVGDLQRIGPVIDAALARGATGVSNVEFASNDEEGARHRALTQAVENAREEAAVLARALGGSLGPLLDISTSPDPSYIMGRLASGYASNVAENTQITPSEIVVEVIVSARWRFNPPPR
jgi:uncharacterized protein